MLSFVVLAPLRHGWVPRWERVSVRSQRREGVSPRVLCGRRRLLFMRHALAAVVAPAHISD